MAKVVWTGAALDSLEHISAYISHFDPLAAERIYTKLIEVTESLADFPHLGRPAKNGAREVPTVPPYILRYEVVENFVNILDIRHGRQSEGV